MICGLSYGSLQLLSGIYMQLWGPSTRVCVSESFIILWTPRVCYLLKKKKKNTVFCCGVTEPLTHIWLECRSWLYKDNCLFVLKLVHVFQTSLELTVWKRMAFNLWFFCLHPPVLELDYAARVHDHCCQLCEMLGGKAELCWQSLDFTHLLPHWKSC